MRSQSQKWSTFACLLASFLLAILSPSSVFAADDSAPKVTKTTSFVQIDDFMVYFDHASAKLDAKDETALDTLATKLKDYPDLRILFVGWASVVGGRVENVDWSLWRARKCRSYLIEVHGIDGARLSVAGHGAEDPKNPTNPLTEEAQATDRRVEAYITNGTYIEEKTVIDGRTVVSAPKADDLNKSGDCKPACDCDAETAAAKLEGFKDGFKAIPMKISFSNGDCKCSSSSQRAYGEAYAEGFNSRPKPLPVVVRPQWPRWVLIGTTTLAAGVGSYIGSRHMNVYGIETENGFQDGYTKPDWRNFAAAGIGAGSAFLFTYTITIPLFK